MGPGGLQSTRGHPQCSRRWGDKSPGQAGGRANCGVIVACIAFFPLSNVIFKCDFLILFLFYK